MAELWSRREGGRSPSSIKFTSVVNCPRSPSTTLPPRGRTGGGEGESESLTGPLDSPNRRGEDTTVARTRPLVGLPEVLFSYNPSSRTSTPRGPSGGSGSFRATSQGVKV